MARTASGQIKLQVVEGRKRHRFRPVIDKHVPAGATIDTDSRLSYQGLSDTYTHNVIDHAEAYVDGHRPHQPLRKLLVAAQASHQGYLRDGRTEPFHLLRYLDEQSFRFNERHTNDASRFVLSLKGILDKRLTYVALTGKELPHTC